MKAFNQNNRLLLKLIKELKKSSTSSGLANRLQNDVVASNRDEFSNYARSLYGFVRNTAFYENTLKQENKVFAKTKKKLKKDTYLEKLRDNIYKDYRMSIKRVEDNRMDVVLKRIKNMRTKTNVFEAPVVTKKKKPAKGGFYSSEDFRVICQEQELKFLDVLNRERNKRGLSTLTIDPKLSQAARYHSYQMAVENFFEHDSYIRNKVTGQLHYVCGTFDRINKFSTSANSENIAAGSGTAEGVYNQWFNSPGHKSNMLSSNHNVIGIGYVRVENSKYTHYWTTDFRD